MNEKKIEPTQAMVDIVDLADKLMVMDTRDLLRTALNHPDAAGLFADEDDRPWEPLGESDQVCVGDEVRQELNGGTTLAVVGRVDGEGDPWTTEDRFIGVLDEGTWYVRRAVQELPTEDGAVIVPAEGREFIETRSGKKSRRLTWDAESYVWYDARGTHLDADIITGTWKVDGK